MPRPDPVLLLHGQPGAARDWDRVRAAIGSPPETIAIDRPGWDGGSAPSDLEGNARAALDALDAAGAERAVVVGHSFGGAVAAWLAATHEQRVRALVLAAPSANAASLQWLDRILATPGLGFVAGAAALAGSGVALAARPLRARVATSGWRRVTCDPPAGPWWPRGRGGPSSSSSGCLSATCPASRRGYTRSPRPPLW